MEMKAFLNHLKHVKEQANGSYMACCPSHDDHNPSLSIGLSPDGKRILVHCFTGCPEEKILSSLGLKKSDLFINSYMGKNIKNDDNKHIYRYMDENGKLLYEKTRADFGKKEKRFWFTDANGKKGIKDIDKRVPYNLPNVIKADKIIFVEGEKCAEAVIAKGYCATTLDSGANSKWRPEYAEYFKGKDVIIIPDCDRPGMEYAKKIQKGISGSKIICLPEKEKGYDIADWLSDGKTMEEVMQLPLWEENDGEQVEEKHSKRKTKEKGTDVDTLLDILQSFKIDLYLNQVNAVYAVIPNEEHMETWQIKSSAFSEWLQGVFYKEEKRPIKADGIKQVIDILSARAKFETRKQIELYNRVASHEKGIWYDLSNEKWQAIRITVDGWSVENNPPILFERFNHQNGQVLPKENGDINKIFDYINLKEDHVLFLCWMVSCFVPEIPHAISIIYGEKGAAKSTACEILKMLIDPSVLEHMTLENDQRTLVINLTNHWYLPFDNVSAISSSTSDMLCRAVTGGGVQQRKLCTNAEDYVFKFKRCLSINGINNVATRADLLDRSILFELKRISGKDRKEIREVYENFEKDRESILGGIFDVLSKAMRLYDSVKLESLPRMADFARWGYAIGEALGGYGTEFLDEYKKNQQSRNYEIINLDIVGWLIVQFMEERECWSGYAQELFNQLKEIAERNGIDFRSSEMPKQPNGLTRRMGAIKSNLEDVGISYVKKMDAKGTRIDIKNSNISPLPPYAESVGDIGENSNGDNNGDKFSEKVLPPYENIRNNGADGENGENGDICPDNQ